MPMYPKYAKQSKARDILGTQMRLLLENENMTQSQLAAAINMSHVTISMICTGRKLPSTFTLLKIAEHFGKSLDYFFRREIPFGKINLS